MYRMAISALIEKHEGRRYTAYYDSKRKLTIGVGFNLNDPSAQQTIESFGWNYDDLCNGLALSDAQIDELLDHSINIAIAAAQALFPSFDFLPDNVQAVLADMSFNMGSFKLFEFTELREAIAARDFNRAAKEMIDSLWYSEVGNRGIEDVALMKGAL